MPQNIIVNAMNLGELETEVLRKLWIDTTEDTDGFSPDSAFSKYSRYRVRKKINQAYLELATLTKAIRSWFIITLTANYSQYLVPPNCFDIEDVYYFSSATVYEKLDVYEESLIEEQLSPGWKTTPGTPAYAYVADRNKMGVKLGLAPAPTTSGTALTLGTGVYSKTQPYGVIEAVSGYANPGSATNTYTDAAGQNFDNLGVVIGLTLFNISDGSTGIITSITTVGSSYDTLICSAGFSGGSVNAWTPGDAMRVLGGEYGGLVQIGDVEAEFLLTGTIGKLPSPGITMAAGNVLVRGIMHPVLLVNKYQYPELSPICHPYIALGAAALLGIEEPADSPEFAQVKVYEEKFNSASILFGGISAAQYKGKVQLWSRRV